MYNFTIKVDNKELVLTALKSQIKSAMNSVGTEAKEDVAQRAPVDTGALKRSIKHKVGDGYVDIYSDVEYAPYQEFGTSKISPRHFMKNGLETNIKKYGEIIENHLKG